MIWLLGDVCNIEKSEARYIDDKHSNQKRTKPK